MHHDWFLFKTERNVIFTKDRRTDHRFQNFSKPDLKLDVFVKKHFMLHSANSQSFRDLDWLISLNIDKDHVN